MSSLYGLHYTYLKEINVLSTYDHDSFCDEIVNLEKIVFFFNNKMLLQHNI